MEKMRSERSLRDGVAGFCRNLYFRLKKNDGFTLIELLVVVIIIGILSSIAVVGISGARKSAYAGQCTANTSQLLKAIIAYKAATDLYPGESSTASSKFTPPYTFTKNNLTVLTTAGSNYLSSLPPLYDDGATNNYYIKAVLDTASGQITVKGYTDAAGTTEMPGCKLAQIL